TSQNHNPEICKFFKKDKGFFYKIYFTSYNNNVMCNFISSR
ncbi:unnamed protein product, partial [marine sediment metagenome]